MEIKAESHEKKGFVSSFNMKNDSGQLSIKGYCYLDDQNSYNGEMYAKVVIDKEEKVYQMTQNVNMSYPQNDLRRFSSYQINLPQKDVDKIILYYKIGNEYYRVWSK